MTVRVWQDEATDDRVVYAFGSDDTTAGRVALDRASGDVEILDLDASTPPPGEQFYLAAVVPRLHQYHANAHFPESDTWQV
jgi:hypothetical protein